MTIYLILAKLVMEMKYRYIFWGLVLLVTGFGCSDDRFYKASDKGNPDGELVQAYLKLTVSDFNVISDGTRTAIENTTDKEIANDEENRIDNIWVFQFDSEGNELITPFYYTITEQEKLDNLEKIDVVLKDGVPSTICVVANTNNKDWVKGNGFKTLEGLKGKAISDPVATNLFTEFNPIPMEGSKSDVTISAGTKIEIPVYRMYAKLKIIFDNLVEGMTPKSIQVQNIPNYCQVQSLGKDLAEETPATYNIDDGQWVTRALDTVEGAGAYTEGKEYAVYIPENLQGEKGIQSEVDKKDITEENEDDRVPPHALIINMDMNYKDPQTGATKTLNYKVYPGSNIYNNFNIKRNCVYRVKININSTSQTNHTPSSNCFVVAPGETLSFEPYYRVETGGQYGDDADIFKFNTYLDPEDPTGKKVIKDVQILWQTKDAIGNNSKGDLVKIIPNEQYPLHSEITVKTNKEGNALIGAFNKDDEIIWSWHIWIRDNDPSNVGNAIVYTTYRWEGDKVVNGDTIQGKIYSWQQAQDDFKNELIEDPSYDRVPGYAIMPCNLGALDNEPSNVNNYNAVVRTHGMIYQWGRKDPFPAVSRSDSSNTFEAQSTKFTSSSTDPHYDYTNNRKIDQTGEFGTQTEGSSASDPKVSFYSVTGNTYNSLEESLKFSINNPLVYICGTENPSIGYTDLGSSKKYFADGDWMREHSNKLWGGKDPDLSNMRYYTFTLKEKDRHIFDNYGDKKTIFDPCPTGWRVPPGDLWLGFTKTGLNPKDCGGLTGVNYDVVKTANKTYGMYMYMTKSKWDPSDKTGNKFISDPGPSLYFPCQGTRNGDGSTRRPQHCGNYHNATCDLDNIVNILHIHLDRDVFNIFEYDYRIILKSVAGPIRCVRDRK